MPENSEVQHNKSKRIQDFLPLILVFFTLAVYLPGSGWGIPYPTGKERTYAWGNDDLVPLHALAEMHNTFVVAKPDRNIAYPWFHYFLLACAYSPYLIYLFFTGGLTNPEGVYPFGLSDPVSAFRYLSWIGRSVTMLLALATVLGSYYTGKYLWNKKVGFLAAIFTILMFPMAYYARLGNLDVPVLGWTSLALAVFALSLRHGLTLKRAVWFGVFVALTAATKGISQAAGSFLFLPGVLLWLHLRSGKEDRLWRWTSVWAAPSAGAMGFIITFIIANGIVVDPQRYVQHITKLARVTTKAIYLRYPATPSGFAAQARDLLGYLVDVMSWPLLLIAAVGIMLAIRRDRLALTLALSSLSFFLLLTVVRFSKLHYLLPVALPLNLFAAYALVAGFEYGRRIRAITVIAIIGVSGYLLLQTLDLTHDMMHDSRYAASAWMSEHMQPGSSMLYFGTGMATPAISGDIKTIRVLKRELALPTILENKPDFIFVIPLDFNQERHRVEWRYGPHAIYSDYLPADVFAKLEDGSLGYRPVAQFQTPRLFPWINRPFLSYPTVNPPIHFFAREDRVPEAPKLQVWDTAPHNPRFSRVRELTVDNPLPTD
jgi:hypothetical protein